MSIANKLTTVAENVPKVYNSGICAGEEAFWNAFTNNGERTFYEYAFRQTAFEYIRPTHKIVPKSCRSLSMFHNCRNLKKIEKAHFDLSGVTVSAGASTGGNYNTFVECINLEEIEDVGLPAGGYYYTFAHCKSLHTLAVLRVSEDTKFNNAFMSCDCLQNITIEGTIGQDGLNFSWSPLTSDSMKSIITHLKNMVGTTEASYYTIKFSDSCWISIDDDYEPPEGYGSWRDYVEYELGWLT